MKKVIYSIFLILTVSLTTNVWGQSNAPAVADNANPQDTNIKMRSVELERAKREDERNATAYEVAINSDIETKFPQIREDFEGIQTSQSAIIKAYSTGEKVDYATIESSAMEINKSAKRLDSNLFAEKWDDSKDKSKDEEKEQAKSVRTLIVELDNSIGELVTSSMFQNLRVVDPEVAKKARTNLANIMQISDELAKEAKKLK